MTHSKHVGTFIVCEIHKVHVHISCRSAWACCYYTGRTTSCWSRLWWGVIYPVVTTICISPDVPQTQPVSDLMYRCSSLIKWGSNICRCSENFITDNYAIFFCRAAGNAWIAHYSSREVSHPQVKVLVAVPGIVTAEGCGLYFIVLNKSSNRGTYSYNTICIQTGGVYGSQAKFYPGICSYISESCGNIGGIFIFLSEVFVKHFYLWAHLVVADILIGIVINNVHNYRYDDNIRNGYGRGRSVQYLGRYIEGERAGYYG